MLSPDEIAALLRDLESDRVERTVSTNNTDKFSRAVCAFANDMPNHKAPGVLIIGAEDSGQVVGLPITDRLLQNLAALRSEGHIQPLPSLRVQKVSLPDGEVAVVEVDPSHFPPVRYKGQVHIRVGPRRATANEQEERILSERRSRLLTTFDLQPVPNAELEELSLRLFADYRTAVVAPDVIEANHRTVQEQLAALRCFDLGTNCATVAGLLIVGVNPRFHLPGAYVQFLQFPGKTATELPVDQAEIDGDLRSVVDALHTRLRAHNTTTMTTGEGFQDRLAPAWPEWALREVLHNALIHRDYACSVPIRVYLYSDRIEVVSPGGPFGSVTAQTMKTRTDYRNPAVAEAMKHMGFVNRFGFGLQRAEALMQENGNPPLEYDIDAHAVRVVLYRRGA
jgi:ATP-dependent DNA helicase RecG